MKTIGFLILMILILSIKTFSQKFEFRGRTYTDLTGITSDQPNGLLQLNTYLSYSPLFYLEDSTKKFQVFFFRNLVMDLTISKIEQKDYYLPVRVTDDFSNDGLRIINRTDIYQYSNLRLTPKINLLMVKVQDRFDVYGDFILSYYRLGVLDTLENTERANRQIGNLAYGFNLKAITAYSNSSKKIGFKMSLSYSKIWPSLFNNRYREIAGTQFVDSDKYVSSGDLEDQKKALDITEIILSHRSTKEKEYFLKIGLVGNYLQFKDDVTANSFFTFQLGVELPLEKLLEKAAKDGDDDS